MPKDLNLSRDKTNSSQESPSPGMWVSRIPRLPANISVELRETDASLGVRLGTEIQLSGSAVCPVPGPSTFLSLKTPEL